MDNGEEGAGVSSATVTLNSFDSNLGTLGCVNKFADPRQPQMAKHDPCRGGGIARENLVRIKHREPTANKQRIRSDRWSLRLN